MLGLQTAKTGEWALFLVRVPGQEAQPAGILLVDPVEDQLHVRLRDELETEAGQADDTQEVWRELAADLPQLAQEMGGGTVVLDWLEEHASHTFTLGPRHSIVMQSVEGALNLLFEQYVGANKLRRADVVPLAPHRPLFNEQDLMAARHRLPQSPQHALQTIAALRHPHVNFSRVEELIQQDPTLAAHLLKLANSAMFYAGGEIRTVTRALLHVGLDRAVRYLSAVVLKKLFSASRLQKVWNHSIQAAQVNRQLARLCQFPEPDELLVLGLLHDLGQLVLESLGEPFEQAARRLRHEGQYPVAIERTLLGKSHAEIGADLLAFWSFPQDMVEAVRYHHAPSASRLPLTSFLYVTESWMESNEDVFDPAEHQAALQRLKISNQDLSGLSKTLDPEWALLRFAA